MPFQRFLKNAEAITLAPNVLPTATGANLGTIGPADSGTNGPYVIELFASDPDANYPMTWNIPSFTDNSVNQLADAGPGSLGNTSRYVYIYGLTAGADSFSFTVTDGRGGTSPSATITFSFDPWP